jgi:hypothetical protein
MNASQNVFEPPPIHIVCNSESAENINRLWPMHSRVNGSVIEHLSAQDRLDSRRGLHCLWCRNKPRTPPFGACDTLTIVYNELKMRKLRSLKIKGVKNSKKQITKHYKGQFLNTKKFFLCYSIAIRVQRWL